MAYTLQEILGADNLCGVIQGIKPGIELKELPPAFSTPTRTVKGNYCTYRKVEGTRKLAHIVHYGSPSKARNLTGVSEVPVTLLHTFEHISHDMTVLMNLKQIADEGLQKLGRDEIRRRTVEFKQLFTNLRTASVLSALCKGYIYFDADGNMLTSSTDAVVSVDFQIPSGNIDQCNMLGDGNIISASWATAGTKIHTHIQGLKKAGRKLTGYDITHALYGENILDHFLGNTKLKEIINRNTALQQSFIAGEIADGFLGIKKWVPMYGAFYQDSGGTNRDLMGANDIVFTPDPSPEWYEVIKGTFPVPSNLILASDSLSALGSIKEVAGMFSYAELSTDPVGIKQMSGDTFIPLIKVPGAYIRATVVF